MHWRVKFRLFQISTYSIVFAVIALMALLTGKYIETTALFLSFIWMRNSFGKTWHSQFFWNCIFISCALFIFTILFVPNKNISLFSCIIFGLVIDYVLYKFKDYEDIQKELNKPFNVDTCTMTELLTRCREIGLSEENTELAVEFFIKKTKQREIADRLFIEEKSVQMRKQRLKEKLNKI